MLGIMVISHHPQEPGVAAEGTCVCAVSVKALLPTGVLSCAHLASVADGLSVHGGQHKNSDMLKPSLFLVAFKHRDL